MKRFKGFTGILAIAFLGLLTSFILSKSSTPASSIYDIKINSLMGEEMDLKKFKGKKLLIVNVASKCGYTPQYDDLQKLYSKNKENLTIIGVPCNQFMGQEPGNAEKILTFCKKNYGVEFPIAEKTDVKGKNQHELYKWLTSKELNGFQDSKVKWNFQKYLIDEKGNLVKIYYPGEVPTKEDLGI